MPTIALAVCFALLLFASYLSSLQHDRERQKWTEERRELLNRIQAPEKSGFVAAPQVFEIPEPEPDEWDQVGTIVNDPEAYLKQLEGLNGDIH